MRSGCKGLQSVLVVLWSLLLSLCSVQGQTPTALIESLPDSSFTATSYYPNLGSWDPFKARYSRSGWATLTASTAATNEYLDIDLLQPTVIYSIGTKGNEAQSNQEWVSSYQLLYSLSTKPTTFDNNDELTFYNNGEILNGNTDKGTEVINTFISPITAQYLRFRPRTANGWVILRIELYGHELSPNTNNPSVNPTKQPTNNPTNNPTTSAPTTAIPTTVAVSTTSVTAKHTTAVPTTTVPTTAAPITAFPVTPIPTTSTPTNIPSNMPTTSSPVTNIPTTPTLLPITNPTTYSAVTSTPITDIPTSSAPIPSPITVAPITNIPTTSNPTQDTTYNPYNTAEHEVDTAETRSSENDGNDTKNTGNDDDMSIIYYIVGFILFLCVYGIILFVIIRKKKKSKMNRNSKAIDHISYNTKKIGIPPRSPMSISKSMDDIIDDINGVTVTPMGPNINNNTSDEYGLGEINDDTDDNDVILDDIITTRGATKLPPPPPPISNKRVAIGSVASIDSDYDIEMTDMITPNGNNANNIDYNNSYNEGDNDVINDLNDNYNMMTPMGPQKQNKYNNIQLQADEFIINDEDNMGNDNEYGNTPNGEFIVGENNTVNTMGGNDINYLNGNDIIWNDYINEYGNEPGNATHLQKFSKSSDKYKNLSFKNANLLFNQRRRQGK